MPPLIPPVGAARDDFAILGALAARLGVAGRFTGGRDVEGWLRHLWAGVGPGAPDFDTLRERGVWQTPPPDRPEVLLEAFRADPAAHPLATPSGRIELWSDAVAAAGLAGHPEWRAPRAFLDGAAPGALALLSRQPARFLHSQLAGTALATGAVVAVNPASARGIADGARVRVRSPRGAALATLRHDPGVRPGVALMETGPWFVGPAEADPGGNPNAVTDDAPASPLSQATAAQSCLVTLEPVRAARETSAAAARG